MKLYLFLSITLTLVNLYFGKSIEKRNTENTGQPESESGYNFTENIDNLATENTTNSEEDIPWPFRENFSRLTENNETSTDSYFNWYDDAVTEKIPEPNCPENMQPFMWIPIENIWKCLCIFPFFSTPMNNTCVKRFRQGPCEPGNFVIQPEIGFNMSTAPRCAPNSCLEDELVPHKGQCHNITINSICEHGRKFFNETTAEIECSYDDGVYRTIINAPTRSNNCPSDSRVDKNGRCRRKL